MSSSWIVFSSPEKIAAKTIKNRKKRKSKSEKTNKLLENKNALIESLQVENQQIKENLRKKELEILKLKNELSLAQIEITKISEQHEALEEQAILAELDEYLQD